MFSYLFYLLLAFALSVNAKCNKFVQHGDTSYIRPHDQSQRISNGIVCTEKNEFWGDCAVADPSPNTTWTGCALTGFGMIHAHGFTNLSTIPDSALCAIYRLVSSSYKIPGDYSPNQLPETVLWPSLRGCLNPYPVTGCVRRGGSGYLQYTPYLACVNGTFSQCTSGWGEITDGTAIHLCGISDSQASTLPESSEGPLPGGAFEPDFVHTSVAKAESIRNPANGTNATCDHSSFGASDNVNIASSSCISAREVLWITAIVGVMISALQF